MIVILIFVVLLAVMFLAVPISVATGIATIAGFVANGSLSMMAFVQRMGDGLNSFTLIAIPLFMLTGRVMSMGGVTDDLLRLASALLGWLRGGLGYVNILASMFFAGITGSCSADTASEGAIIIPAMKKAGYDASFAVSVTIASSTIGVIIPPSIPLVMYAAIASASVPKLLLGGFIPGIIMGLAQMVVTFIIAKKRNYPRMPLMPFKEIVMSFVKAIPALMCVVILLGGIMSGIFTPTEAAAIAALYSLILALFYYKEIKFKQLPAIFLETAISSGVIMLLIMTATALGYVLSMENMPRAVAAGLLSISTNKYVILLLINALLLFVGMWLDMGAALIIFAPVLMPLVTSLGVDPVHFGLIMVVNLAIGTITPPVGSCLFIGCAIAEISMFKLLDTLIPFILCMIVSLLIVTYVPQTVLFLPNLLFP